MLRNHMIIYYSLYRIYAVSPTEWGRQLIFLFTQPKNAFTSYISNTCNSTHMNHIYLFEFFTKVQVVVIILVERIPNIYLVGWSRIRYIVLSLANYTYICKSFLKCFVRNFLTFRTISRFATSRYLGKYFHGGILKTNCNYLFVCLCRVVQNKKDFSNLCFLLT